MLIEPDNSDEVFASGRLSERVVLEAMLELERSGAWVPGFYAGPIAPVDCQGQEIAAVGISEARPARTLGQFGKMGSCAAEAF